MSELFEALKKIENNNEDTKKDIPDFVNNKRKPPYFLIAAVVIFVAFAVLSGVYFLEKIRYYNGNYGHVPALRNPRPNIRKVKLMAKSNIPILIQKRQNSKSQIQHEALTIKKQQNKVASAKKAVSNTKRVNVSHRKKVRTRKLEKKHVSIKSMASTEKENIEETNVFMSAKREQDTTAKLLKLATSDDFYTSVSAYNKLLKRYPHNVSLYNNLAVKYMERGFYGRAAEILKKALLISNDTYIKINLAICYVKLKEINEAKQIVNSIRSSSPRIERILANLKTALSE